MFFPYFVNQTPENEKNILRRNKRIISKRQQILPLFCMFSMIYVTFLDARFICRTTDCVSQKKKKVTDCKRQLPLLLLFSKLNHFTF